MDTLVGLDIGTTKVAVVVAEIDHGGAVKVVGVGHAPFTGIKRGVVVHLEQTVDAIRAAVAEAERMAGVPVRQVTAGTAGEHVRSINSRGVIAVSRGGSEVGADDVALPEPKLNRGLSVLSRLWRRRASTIRPC